MLLHDRESSWSCTETVREIPTRVRPRATLAVALISILTASSTLRLSADNGSLLRVSDVLTGVAELADITLDTSDGSFWVLGANGTSTANHKIYRLDNSLTQVLGEVTNPHPTGTIANNDLTTHRGITHRALDNQLLVLSSVGPRLSQTFMIRAIDRNGTIHPGIELTVNIGEGTGASLHGLAYDTFTRDFWTIDTRSDRLLRISASTGELIGTLVVPGKDTEQTQLSGHGISFRASGAAGLLHVAYGDIFSAGPSKIIELTTELPAEPPVDTLPVAVATGAETQILFEPRLDLKGLQTYSDRFGKGHIAIVDQGGRIYDIERSRSNPLPPTHVECFLTLDNEVRISWQSHGSGSAGEYGGEIQVLRSGIPVTTIAGSTRDFTDSSPIEGTSTYSLRASESPDAPLGASSCPCQVTVGRGGLVDWTPFPGLLPADVTEHPVTRELYITDRGAGKIYRLDAELELIEVADAPFPDPVGIALVPQIVLGFPPAVFENLLAVGESSGSRIRFIHSEEMDAGTITTLNVQFDGVERPELGGMTFKPDTGELFISELSTRETFRFASNGKLSGRCSPVFVTEPLGGGITYDPIQDSFLASFEGGTVREMFAQASCATSEFGFGLEGLGPSFAQDGFVSGLQISQNTLLIVSPTVGAIFRVLLFPFSPNFIRGDVDGSGTVNITDAFELAVYLFQSGTPPGCNDAADTNDDGVLDVSDPVFLLFSLFVPGSAAPPQPFPAPGNDPTFRDNLGCAN
jgi:hypothetical protein